MARGLLRFPENKDEFVDAQVTLPANGTTKARNTGYGTESPLQRFLTGCYEEFRADDTGAVADYIPELQRADPAHFGIGLVTIDGHVYEAGDSAVPFTIQSVSKAFVFALALETVGEERSRPRSALSRAARLSTRSGSPMTTGPSIPWSMRARSPARD